MNRAELGKSFVEHREFGIKERKKLAAKGQALPGGGFPIRNRQDLKNAIQAIGRASNYTAAKAHIIKRAKALGLTDLLPDGWIEKEAAQMDKVDNFLTHHGIKGMRWGVRRSKSQLSKEAKSRTGKSVKDLSDEDLKKLVNRLNMEQQYTRLTSGKSGSTGKRLVSAGAAFVGGIALNVARTQIQNAATKQVSDVMARRATYRTNLKKTLEK